MVKKFSLLFIFLLIADITYTQEKPDSIEVNIIENFVTPESPYTFKLTFFTSADCKSKVIIDGKNTFDVSTTPAGTHEVAIDISKLNLQGEFIPFIILVEDSLGNKFKSEQYEFELPKEVKLESESNFLFLCLFAGTVFILPSPVLADIKGETYFSLTKEIPLLFIRSSGYQYPAGYFSIEYSHIFNAPVKNFFRVGYKHLIQIPGIEYISPGINGFTNFKGFNGISPEISLGLFRIANTFTLYTRYRFNAKPGENGREFHEFSIGLYSGFFAIYLN
jgi:hypothetical protein